MAKHALVAQPATPRPEKHQASTYAIFSGEEDSDPNLVAEAHRLHVEGYIAAGFIQADEAASLHRAHAALPTVENCHVRYFLAINTSNPADRATSRQLSPLPGQDYRSLPGMRMCDHVLSSEGEGMLHAAATRGPVKEISGLARSRKGSPQAVHEVIRAMLHAAGNSETWVFAIVVQTLHALRRSYGKSAFQVLGGDVPLQSYHGLATNATLTPALWDTASAIATLRNEALHTQDTLSRQRLMRTLAFLEAGRPDDRHPND